MSRSSLVLLILAASVTPPHPAQADEQCAPSCRDGYVCVHGACVSACNPPCSSGLVCRVDDEGADCESEDEDDAQEPAAPKPPPREVYGRREPRRAPTETGEDLPRVRPRHEAEDCRAASNPAKAPAITLGVLSVIGGFANFVVGVKGEDTSEFLVVSGLVAVALGTWAIIGGAVAD